MSMKKIVILMVVLAVASFAVSFGVSYWQGKNAAKQAELVKKQQEEADTAATQPSTDVPAVTAAVESVSPKEKQLDDLVLELKLRTDAVKKREQELDRREKRLAMAQEMLKKQADEVEKLRLELTVPLTGLKEAQADLQKTRVTVAAQEAVNIKKTAAIYEKMDPAAAGRILKGMCSGTQEDDAVKILHYMSDRGAAKLMAELSDQDLAARLCDKLKKVREES